MAIDNNKLITYAEALTMISGGSGGDTSTCVHKTGDETVGGVKTFSDSIVVADASKIEYGGSSPSPDTGTTGYTYVYDTNAVNGSSNVIDFLATGSPKAGIIVREFTGSFSGQNAEMIVFDSSSAYSNGVYSNGSNSHIYSSVFTWSFNSGTQRLTVQGPDSGNYFGSGAQGTYNNWKMLVYYSLNYEGGNLTFRRTSITPGTGVYSVSFSNLAGQPVLFAVLMQTDVTGANYRRAAAICGVYGGSSYASTALTFYGTSMSVYNASSALTVSYNNGTLSLSTPSYNNGFYFHNPGTYTLYYLTAEDVPAPTGGGGGGSSVTPTFQNLAEELATKYEKPSGGIPASDIASGVIPTVPQLSTNVANDKASNTKTSTPASVYAEIHPTTGSSYTNMLPNKYYNLGTLTGSRTLTFNTSGIDNGIENEWKFQFSTSYTAPTITWPSQITTWEGGSAPTIKANKTYQVYVLNGIAVIGEF